MKVDTPHFFKESLMRSPVIAIVLCIASASAVAQCVAQQPAELATTLVATAARPGPDPKKPTPELIKTAGAVTHDAPVMRATPAPDKHAGDDEHRSGTAMLLAALAVMSGIALRRFSSREQ
jgi:hypothetical protein